MPIQGHFCKLCKELVKPAEYESHCKKRPHYDKFVDAVNGKKTKAFQVAQVKTAKNPAEKRKTLQIERGACPAEDSEEDSDIEETGNWKRQKKQTEYPVAYDF